MERESSNDDDRTRKFVGMKPLRNRRKRSKVARSRSPRLCSSAIRYEQLEPRQLLAVLVANFGDDFPLGNDALQTGWQYQWNAPVNGDPSSGGINHPETEFVSLAPTSTGTNWSPDGDLLAQNDLNAAYLRLSAFGGHPGATGDVVGGENRYAIASYTISESGYYSIEDSFVGLQGASYAPLLSKYQNDGVEYLVFVNRESPIESGVVHAKTKAYFDTSLGFLSKGDTVHVAFGANTNDLSDYFTTDFSIVRNVELEEVVGEFRNDFSGDTSTDSGWSYLWNPPANWNQVGSTDFTQGEIGDPNNYVPLKQAGGIWTADGDLDGLNSSPDHFLKLSPTGGHAGSGYSDSPFEDRFAIAAFTVENSGLYAIQQSHFTVDSRSDDGMEIFIHVDDEPIISSQTVAAGQVASFDQSLGYLKQGETI